MGALPPSPPLGFRGGPRVPHASLAEHAVRALLGLVRPAGSMVLPGGTARARLPGLGPVAGMGQGAHGAPRGRGPWGSPRSAWEGSGRSPV